MKMILLIAVCNISLCCYAQRVAINTDGSAPDASAILDVKSTNKGFLPPRIALTGLTDIITIASPATGLLIYNTVSAGEDPTTVSPGYYYYTGTVWASLSPGPPSWSNSGNNASSDDYIGTNNQENFAVKVNGIGSGLIDQFDGNTFWGYRSGLNNDDGFLNTAIGANALQFNTSSYANTALGANALTFNSTGVNNSATGAEALYSNTSGYNNTANGVGTLYSNTTGSNNNAFGGYALFSNITGENNTASGQTALYANTTGNYNTANGSNALQSNSEGVSNTASGANALQFNTTGNYNTANGDHALYNNTTGENNTATGISALLNNTTGNYNVASGSYALIANTTGIYNAAVGDQALRSNNNGENNTAMGAGALYNNTTGNNNIALGSNAGNNLTAGNNNIAIGNSGVAAESSTIRIGTDGTHLNTYIAGIKDYVSTDGVPVYINADGKLGTLTSAGRLKENIEDISKTSDGLLKLHPVSFVYKDAVANGDKTIQYGLIAEEVAKINPALVIFDKDGKPNAVRYQMLTPMLVNELQKEHKINQEQNEKIQSLQKQIDELKLLIGKSK